MKGRLMDALALFFFKAQSCMHVCINAYARTFGKAQANTRAHEHARGHNQTQIP